jgi:helix-turn-helix protein
MNCQSQTTRIYGHLTRGPITPLQALARYGVFRLAARIRDLREKGHKIKTETVTRGGKNFARYRMI